MIKIINSRKETARGNGLPFYKFLTDQIRFNTTKPYYDGLTICPSERVPTFQFESEFDFDICNRFLEDDSIFGVLPIGGDETFEIIKRPLSNGNFLYISADYSKSLASSGVYYLAFGRSIDPVGTYLLYSEQFKGINAALSQPCIINANTP